MMELVRDPEQIAQLEKRLASRGKSAGQPVRLALGGAGHAAHCLQSVSDGVWWCFDGKVEGRPDTRLENFIGLGSVTDGQHVFSNWIEVNVSPRGGAAMGAFGRDAGRTYLLRSVARIRESDPDEMKRRFARAGIRVLPLPGRKQPVAVVADIELPLAPQLAAFARASGVF